MKEYNMFANSSLPLLSKQQINATNEIYIIKDVEHRYQQINALFAKLTNSRDKNSIIGKTLYEIDAPISAHASFMYASETDVLITQRPKSLFAIFTYHSHIIKAMVMQLSPVLKDGVSQGISLAARFVDDSVINRLGINNLIERHKNKKCNLHITQTIQHKIDGLTPRESETLFFLLRGHTAKEVGKHLGISNRTVETHIESIKNKLDCQTKKEIIELGHINGYVDIIPASLLKA
jgi:DNA-binding CsgD family transcriptional regulator